MNEEIVVEVVEVAAATPVTSVVAEVFTAHKGSIVTAVALAAAAGVSVYAWKKFKPAKK